jgi:hypothetical protein
VCVSSAALILSSAFCFAEDCAPNNQPLFTAPEIFAPAYQPPNPDAPNTLRRVRFRPPGGGLTKWPTVLMLPPDVFTAEYGEHGVPSERWATYDLQQAGFLVFQVNHRLAPPNKVEGQMTDGYAPAQMTSSGTFSLRSMTLSVRARSICWVALPVVAWFSGARWILLPMQSLDGMRR